MNKYLCSFLLIWVFVFHSCNFKTKIETTEQHSADYYYNRGVLCYHKGEYKDALDNYNKAITLDSAISNYYNNRGIVREIVLNDTMGALNDYKKAIQLDSRNASAYLNMGSIHSLQGNARDAVEYYKICIAIDSNIYQAYHNLAISQYELKDYQASLDNFRISVIHNNASSNYYYCYYYMGLIYKETGEIGKAKEYLEKAKALGNKDAEEELKTF